MKTTLTLLLLAPLAWAAAAGTSAAPSPARQEHAQEHAVVSKAPEIVAKAPATVERKSPAPDDGQWHFAGEPTKSGSIHPILLTPPGRPAMIPHPAQAAPPKPAALKPEPLIETESYKPVSASVQVRPPAVVGHHGSSFTDQPHHGPNPPVIVGVAANAKSASTGAIDGTEFHRRF